MPNPGNLQPVRTHEEAVERGRKGGKAKKGSKHLSTHIQEMLNDPKFELKLKDGSVLKERPIAAIIKTAVAKGISGEVQWAEWLAKHGYGTKVNLEVEDPIKLIIEKYGKGEISEVPESEEAEG